MKRVYYYKTMELTDDDYLEIIENHINHKTEVEDTESLVEFLKNKLSQLNNESKWKHLSFRKIHKQIYLINNAFYESVDYIESLIIKLRSDIEKLIEKLEYYMSILKGDEI